MSETDTITAKELDSEVFAVIKEYRRRADENDRKAERFAEDGLTENVAYFRGIADAYRGAAERLEQVPELERDDE